MIPVPRPPEPDSFDARCRQPGNTWLANNPTSQKFPAYWIPFQPDLGAAFAWRCGWWAMWVTDGEVDHYLSKKNHRELAYEWRNYRFIAGTVNSSKLRHDNNVLDPYEVVQGWFEILLPSLELVITNNVPQNFRAKAEFTLTKLKLDRGEKIRRVRRKYYERYKQDGNLNGLRHDAPLIADAVQKCLNNGRPLP
jgi:hypothetical protein